MAEDAGKKDDIRKFLKRVNNGVNFIEDIWIEREVKQPGSEGKFNEARSISGRPISNITELLNDDLKHSFEDGSFTFRFIAAVAGSGKTTLLSYLRELIEVEHRRKEHAIVVQFPFNELLSQSGNDSFGVKFYAYVLSLTFWELMRADNSGLSKDIKKIAEKSLSRIIGEDKVAQLRLKVDSEMDFTEELGEYFSEKKTNFKKRFFSTIRDLLRSDPQVTFVYLMDELDALRKHQNYLQDARSIVRDLINEALGDGGDLRLMIYMVGVSDDVETFIKADQALSSRISDYVINLVAYRREECEQIRAKIEELIKDAYDTCKDFDKAWEEIRNIQLEPARDYSNLRDFCKRFSEKLIEIHEKYFNYFDKPFNKYESKARQIIEKQLLDKWGEYLGDYPREETNSIEQSHSYLGHRKWKKYRGKSGFALLVAKTTTTIRGIENHAVDCYAELWHNDHQVAKAYGEAKNYPLIKEHIDTFHRWLNEFNYEPSPTNNNPPEFAFIISPFATDLQIRKLKIKGIEFIEVEKIDEILPVTKNVNGGEEKKTYPETEGKSVGINTSGEETLINALKDSRFIRKTMDKLIRNRPYKDLTDLIRKTKFSPSIKKKLQYKITRGDIKFD